MSRTCVFAALTLLAVCATASAEQPLTEDAYEAMWHDWVKEFDMSFSPFEVMGRYKTFKDSVDFIHDHNKNHAETSGYTVGLNEFAHMTNNEFRRFYTGYNAPINKVQNNLEILDETLAPSDVDWVKKNAVTAVKNQGQCGSCWAFSTTGSVEGAHAIKTGKLTSFSEQELVSCASSFGNQGCNGGLMDDGFKYIESKGDVLESTYPYTGKTGTCSKGKTSPSAVGVSGFKDVKANNEKQLQAAVAIGPVSVAIEADQSGFQFYKTGVFGGKCGNKLDHGVLVVGYGSDGGKSYWKVKNSWGASWGEKGYIRLAKDVSSKSGQCGLASQPSYPTIGATPAPGPPTPPTPPTPPSPPAPAGKSYEAPPCSSGEQPVRVQGLSGDFCSPSCSPSSPCPAVPKGVTGEGKCILQTSGSSTPTNCAIVCDPSSNGQCPKGATCQPIQGTGLCTYAEAKDLKNVIDMILSK